MIIPSTSPAAALRFTPSWLRSDPTPPVFLLRAGDVLERELMQADLAGEYRAGEIWPWDMRDAIMSGLQALGGTSAGDLVALAEAVLAGEIAEPAQAAIYADALDVLAQHWPSYRLLLAQQERRNALVPIVAFRRFCCGWENVAAEYRTGIDRLVDKAQLAAIDPLVLRTAGLEAYNLQWGLSAEKNSAAPSKSAADPATSSSGAPSKAAGGRSAGTSTRKIRA